MVRQDVPGERVQRLRLAGRTLLAVASAAVLVVTGYAWALSRQLDASSATSAVLDPSAGAGRNARTGPTNVLLVGLDSRTDAEGNPLPPEVLAALHAGGDSGELNTDTLILVHVPPDPSQPTVVVSIPRDSYVTVPGYGKHKINSAYQRAMLDARRDLASEGVSGSELTVLSRQAGGRELVQTVEALTGVTVDHYAEITLAGFYEITQAVGGVPVCLNTAVRDSYSGADLAAGPQTVSGAAALAFVRQRHDLPRGDLDRIVRQQAFLAGLAHRVLSGGVLANPYTLAQLSGTISRYVVIDQGWSLTGLLRQTRSMNEGPIQFWTPPVGRLDLPTPEDGMAVQVDPAQVRQFLAELTNSGRIDPERTRAAMPHPAGPVLDGGVDGSTVAVAAAPNVGAAQVSPTAADREPAAVSCVN